MNYRHLLPKFAAGNATEQERTAFHQWLDTLSTQEFQEIIDDYEKLLSTQPGFDPHNEKLLNDLLNQINGAAREAPVHRLHFLRSVWLRYAAAVLLVLAGIAIYWSLSRNVQPPAPTAQVPVQHDIAPGRNGALLTLADGRTIALDSLGNGTIATQGGTHVVLRNGQLTYNETQPAAGKGPMYNTMQTPRGRQFQLTLPDGTQVWLNAVSSIKYPTAFTGNTREVEVTGEAYFEVTKYAAKKFMVHTPGCTVEVLGTHFNVNAYDDEETTNITLLEGSVHVKAQAGSAAPGRTDPYLAKAQAILKPGSQARLTLSPRAEQVPGLSVQKVDVDQVVAWKNGVFNFQHSSLPSAMRQIARWYDVEIVYDKNIPNIEFGGKIQRSLSLSQIIKGLGDSTVHFNIEGRKLIVTP